MSRSATMAAATVSRGLDLTPVQFLVVSGIYFRGEPIAAGTTIDAEVSEALELFGNVRVKLVNSGDWKRIQAVSHASSAELLRASQANRGWVRQINRP